MLDYAGQGPQVRGTKAYKKTNRLTTNPMGGASRVSSGEVHMLQRFLSLRVVVLCDSVVVLHCERKACSVGFHVIPLVT